MSDLSRRIRDIYDSCLGRSVGVMHMTVPDAKIKCHLIFQDIVVNDQNRLYGRYRSMCFRPAGRLPNSPLPRVGRMLLLFK